MTMQDSYYVSFYYTLRGLGLSSPATEVRFGHQAQYSFCLSVGLSVPFFYVLSLFFSLPSTLLFSLSLSLSLFHLIYLFLSLLPSLSLPLCLSVFASVSDCLSVCLSVCLLLFPSHISSSVVVCKIFCNPILFHTSPFSSPNSLYLLTTISIQCFSDYIKCLKLCACLCT